MTMEVSQVSGPPRRRRSIARARPAVAAQVWFVGIVLLAIAVRFVAIGQHWGTDDGYSYLIATSPSPHVFLARLAAYENTPPLFYLVLSLMPTDHSAWMLVPVAVAGVLGCIALYFGLRRPLGTEAALIAALALAVAPFEVSYSNLSRAFLLADLALLVALWAVLRLSEHESRRWWAVYLIAGVLALYSEYDSAIFVVALTASALRLGAPKRRHMAVLGPLPLLAIIPWIPQIVRGEHAVGKTKLATPFAAPSLHTLRELTASLVLGSNGGTSSTTGQWLEFGAIAVVGAAAVIVLRRVAAVKDERWRYAIALIAGTGALTLLGHAIAPIVGVQLFTERYLTILIPLGVALAAAVVASTGARWPIVITSLVLVAVGAVNLKHRYNHQWEPDLRPVRAAALALHPKTVLTDNPDVVYYLKSLHPVLDRPFNLGPGRAPSCARPCLVVDDSTSQFGTPRTGLSGSSTTVGSFVLTMQR